MRIFNICSLYLFILFSPAGVNTIYGQNTKSKSLVNERTSRISGKIKNYQANKNNGFIIFRTSTLNGISKDTSIYINKDGFFSVDLLQDFEADFTLLYYGESVNLYYTPGENLNIEIDEIKWRGTENRTKSLSLSGKAAIFSELIGAFTNDYVKNQFTLFNWFDSTLSDQEAALGRIAKLREEESYLSTYLKKNKISNVQFAHWAKNFLVYNAGIEINFESFSSARNKSMTIGQLMYVLKDIKVENPEALNNSSYYHFLRQLQGSFQIIVNINPLYKELVKINGINPIPVYLQFIDQYSHGIARQLMYYDLFLFYPRNYYSYLFDNVILEMGLKRRFEIVKSRSARPFIPFNVIARLDSAKVDSSIKNRLISIFESRSDSFLFVDFWGTWCAPCMNEMPLYAQFISKFQDRNIRFLFLAVSSEEIEVLKIKEKYHIPADFIVLTDNEVNIMRNILKIDGYPRHFIIAPNGNVVENDIPHINNSNILNETVVEKIKRQILKE